MIKIIFFFPAGSDLYGTKIYYYENDRPFLLSFIVVLCL